MTRDPYIALGACYEHLLFFANELEAEILMEAYETTTIPLYLYRPHIWRWRRRLIKDTRPHWRKRLTYLRAFAVVEKFMREDGMWPTKND